MGLVAPSNIEAERTVLGGMLWAPDECVPVAMDMLVSDDFVGEHHSELFGAIVKCYQERGRLDGGLLPVSNLGIFEELRLGAHTSAIEPHCVALKEVSEKRFIARECQRTVGIACQPNIPVDDVRAAVQRIVSRVDSGSGTDTPLGAIVDAELDANSSTGQGRISTGLPELDSILDGGLQTQSLYILGARRGVGKTAFGAHIACKAMEQGVKVCWVAAEMSRQQMVRRFIQAVSGVQVSNRIAEFSEEELEQRRVAGRKIKRWSPTIEDKPVSITQVYGRCRRWASQKKLGLLVLDYLQILKRTRTDNPVEAISEISRGAKQIAKDFAIPVLGMAQIRREGEGSGFRPRMANLKGSGSLEEDADVVCLLWPGREGRQLMCAVDKNRHGITADCRLFADFGRMRFGSWYPVGGDEHGRGSEVGGEAPSQFDDDRRVPNQAGGDPGVRGRPTEAPQRGRGGEEDLDEIPF